MLAKAITVATALSVIHVALYATPSTTSRETVEIHELGHLYFTEEKLEYIYYFNTSELLEDISKIETTTNEILKICKKTYLDECQPYIEDKEKNEKLLHSTTKYVKSFIKLRANKPKRCLGILCWDPLDILNTLEEGLSEVKDVKRGSTLKAIKEYVDNDKKTILRAFGKYKGTNKDDSKTKGALYNILEFYKLAVIRGDLMIRFEENMIKLKSIFDKKPINEIWNKRDLDKFLLTISMSKLKDTLSFPSKTPESIIELSETRTIISETHIKIIVKIPMINKFNYTLYEFIPLPFKVNDAAYIINMTSGYFIRNPDRETYMLPHNIFNGCSLYNNITICDATVKKKLEKADECIHSLANGHYSNKCMKLRIDSKNYLIKLSNESIFCFVVEPIDFKLICDNGTRYFNITVDTRVNVSRPCELHKLTFDTQKAESQSDAWLSNLIPDSESLILNTTTRDINKLIKPSIFDKSPLLSALGKILDPENILGKYFVKGTKVTANSLNINYDELENSLSLGVKDAESTKKAVEDGFNAIGEQGSEIAKQVVDAFEDSFKYIDEQGSEITKKVADTLEDSFNSIGEQGSEITKKVVDTLGDGFNSIGEKGSEILGDISDTLQVTSHSIGEDVSGIWQSTIVSVNNAWQSSYAWCGENVPYAWNASINWVNNAATFLYDMLLEFLLKILYITILLIVVITTIRYTFKWLKKRTFGGK